MTIEIELTQGKVALIYDVDYELVAGHKWYAKKCYGTFYAFTNKPAIGGKRQTLRMHRLILGLTDPAVHADHIDRDGLNNTRANLRACTVSENARNRGKQINNKSGYKGVSWSNESRKWLAQIKLHRVNNNLGRFDTPEEAYAAYCAAAIKLHGEFARLA